LPVQLAAAILIKLTVLGKALAVFGEATISAPLHLVLFQEEPELL